MGSSNFSQVKLCIMTMICSAVDFMNLKKSSGSRFRMTRAWRSHWACRYPSLPTLQGEAGWWQRRGLKARGGFVSAFGCSVPRHTLFSLCLGLSVSLSALTLGEVGPVACPAFGSTTPNFQWVCFSVAIQSQILPIGVCRGPGMTSCWLEVSEVMLSGTWFFQIRGLPFLMWK